MSVSRIEAERNDELIAEDCRGNTVLQFTYPTSGLEANQIRPQTDDSQPQRMAAATLARTPPVQGKSPADKQLLGKEEA
eukprot:5739629-Pleurochrysis_carterae.AAC.3